jgi:hypothetical protein
MPHQPIESLPAPPFSLNTIILGTIMLHLVSNTQLIIMAQTLDFSSRVGALRTDPLHPHTV